jgi:hypothetical protein
MYYFVYVYGVVYTPIFSGIYAPVCRYFILTIYIFSYILQIFFHFPMCFFILREKCTCKFGGFVYTGHRYSAYILYIEYIDSSRSYISIYALFLYTDY